MSTTNDPYVTFRPLGMADRRINRIVFVLYNLLIFFVVDLIHLFLYFSFVMSSWYLRDFAVSGQITALAISGERAMRDVGLDDRQHVEFAKREAMIRLGQCFSHHVLRQVVLPGAASHHTM
jgi:hypothetical protein